MKNVSQRYFFTIGMLLLVLQPVFCQRDTSSIRYVAPNEVVSGSIMTDTTSRRVHSPGLAALMSAVVPGLGQVYNKKYWKVPLIYGGFAGGFYLNRQLHDRYLMYKNAYKNEKTKYLGSSIPDTVVFRIQGGFFSPTDVVTYRNKYRRLQDLTTIGLAVWYCMNIIDASVDAYFFNFDMSDDLSLHVMPSGFYLNTNTYYAALSLRLSLKQ
jgi:hypothetical protein